MTKSKDEKILHDAFAKPDKEEERGIKAIMALQAAGGIVETPEEAEAGWNALSESQRKQTIQAADAVCPGWRTK